MKIVRVIYTTRPEYAAANQANIASIVEELRALDHPGIKYGCYLLPDGKTFLHFDQFENEDAHEVLTALESFKKFAAELEASSPEVEPKLELLSLVAATENFWP
jgi:quinol monooxygenase YgiN